jgi:hypothetical protein
VRYIWSENPAHYLFEMPRTPFVFLTRTPFVVGSCRNHVVERVVMERSFGAKKRSFVASNHLFQDASDHLSRYTSDHLSRDASDHLSRDASHHIDCCGAIIEHRRASKIIIERCEASEIIERCGEREIIERCGEQVRLLNVAENK